VPGALSADLCDAGRPEDASWVSSLYLLTSSSPSSWCGRRWWPCVAPFGRGVDGSRSTVDAAARFGGRTVGDPVDGSRPRRRHPGSTPTSSTPTGARGA